jgi:hypothetical protein
MYDLMGGVGRASSKIAVKWRVICRRNDPHCGRNRGRRSKTQIIPVWCPPSLCFGRLSGTFSPACYWLGVMTSSRLAF